MYALLQNPIGDGIKVEIHIDFDAESNEKTFTVTYDGVQLSHESKIEDAMWQAQRRLNQLKLL